MNKSNDSDSPQVIVCGVMPPPVTGMTLCTECVAEVLAKEVTVQRINWSNGSSRITWPFRFAKLGRASLGALSILLKRRHPQAVLYMPANSKGAIGMNILTIAVAKLRGYRCILHHHIYNYLTSKSWRMSVLCKLFGPRDLHLVLCTDMQRKLTEHYGSKTPCAIVPSTIQLLQLNHLTPSTKKSKSTDNVADGKTDASVRQSNTFRLGFISNIQIAKGLDLVLDTFRLLRNQHKQIQLVLAGPLHSDIEKRMLEEAKIEFGEALDYRGPVYENDKERFFNDIHAKLYPTRFDAQPLVVTETFARKKPVISFGVGCVTAMMGKQTEWVIPPGTDFIQPAADLVTTWIESPQAYEAACLAAGKRYQEMLQDAESALEQLTKWISCDHQEASFFPSTK